MQQAVCVRRREEDDEKKLNPAAAKANHEIHRSSATATGSRQRATNTPYALAHTRPGT